MTTVPLTIRPDDEPGTAQLFVTAQVDGVDEEFLLDTGGSRSRVRRSERTDRWAVEDADDSSRGALGTATGTARARVPRIAVGPIVARDVLVDVSDGTDDTAGPAAILGLDVLAGHRIDLRLADAACVIDETAAVDRWRPMVQSSRGHPHVTVAWDAAAAAAVWDTGASITIVDADLVSRHPELFTPAGTSVGTDAHGNVDETDLVTMTACRIGEREFAPALAAVAPIAGIHRAGDPAFELILGYPHIAQSEWAIDLREGRWGFLD